MYIVPLNNHLDWKFSQIAKRCTLLPIKNLVLFSSYPLWGAALILTGQTTKIHNVRKLSRINQDQLP